MKGMSERGRDGKMEEQGKMKDGRREEEGLNDEERA